MFWHFNYDNDPANTTVFQGNNSRTMVKNEE